ncbi:MAG: ferredoxin reductase family protein [Actinomycetota bacterium]
MQRLIRRLLGRPADWHLYRPRLRLPRPSLAWVGTVAVIASCAVSWLAFDGTRGEDGDVSFGLWVGAVSILLMAWSFVLAVRIRPLERWFGGLDSMYRVHRWAGAFSVLFMFLHTRAEPEIEGGVLGAGRAVADSAEGLAGTGEIMLYVLVGLSALRWMPYRWWRWTHKLLGVPFAFASWHFFTAEKPYANGSGWGWWFGGFMLAGLIAWIARIGVRDAAAQGRRHRITSARTEGSTTTIEMEPVGRPLQHRSGQFVFLKVQARGLREPHAFTIASAPGASRLRFVIRDLGDWTARLCERVERDGLVGSEVIVEGPYGEFRPVGRRGQPVVWIAGGVGITPFLAAIDDAGPDPTIVPHLLYAVRSADENGVVEELRRAASAGRIRLTVFESSAGRRLSPADLDPTVGRDLAGAHVALCGPASLVADMAAAARRGGAAEIETEDFDIRQGFGPDLSADIDELVRTRRPSHA